MNCMTVLTAARMRDLRNVVRAAQCAAPPGSYCALGSYVNATTKSVAYVVSPPGSWCDGSYSIPCMARRALDTRCVCALYDCFRRAVWLFPRQLLPRRRILASIRVRRMRGRILVRGNLCSCGRVHVRPGELLPSAMGDERRHCVPPGICLRRRLPAGDPVFHWSLVHGGRCDRGRLCCWAIREHGWPGLIDM